jgi:predicted HD superfamily hydrolase involved in NAD metabolism
VTLPSYDTARAALGLRLGARGLAHSDGVAETAAHLADVYGVDVPTARLSGLLHDWCKEVDRDDLVVRARALGLAVTDVDLARPYLLHGPVGAAELAEAFPEMPSPVLHAIEVHTFGALEMSDLDRVVYIADTIEPGREHHGVDRLRAVVGEVPLPELMVLTYARSVQQLVNRRKLLHPTTVAVWNQLVAEEQRAPLPAGRAGA